MKQRLAKLCLSVTSFVLTSNAIEVASTTEQADKQARIITAPMEMIRGDGRDPDVKSVFQQELERRQDLADKENSEGHRLEAGSFDANMSMLWDWNHVVNLTFSQANDTISLIPTTGTSDMVVLKDGCERCWSMKGVHWDPDVAKPFHGENSPPVKKLFEYTHMMHTYEIETEGRYWMLDACLKGEVDVCGHHLVTYGIDKAKPWIYTLGNGYLGLGNGEGFDGTQRSNILNQMVIAEMIDEKIFGVHTHMWNSTEEPSQIRFGGYDETLFKEGHNQFWMDTVNNKTWLMRIDDVGFHAKNIWNHTYAMVNPGYPFIGMPDADFEKFKGDLLAAYPDEPVTCKAEDWCYFMTHCDQLRDRMPDLQITFPTIDEGSITYSIPPKSFLYNDVDLKTNMTQCHLGIVAQKFTTSSYWTLGQAFMENFYVTYDARNPEKLRVGLSQNQGVGEETAPKNHESTAFVISVVVITAVVFVAFFAIIVACICARKSKIARLEKAKAYFNSLKTAEQDLEQELDPEDEAEAQRLEDEAKYLAEFNAGNQTSNEQAIGNLL